MAIFTKSTNVVFTELTPGLANILFTLEEFHRNSSAIQPENLYITAIANGVHSQNSRHYTNEAVDLRSHNFPSRESKRIFRQRLELALGHKFRVLLESLETPNEHFHIQVRKGLNYP